jgi:3,4-dihydroxy-2-butanone 4-phosphate synthase
MSTTRHVKYIGERLQGIGEHIEEMVKYYGTRAHFLVLVQANSTIQSISNAPRAHVITMLRSHLEMLEKDMVRPGPASDDKIH